MEDGSESLGGLLEMSALRTEGAIIGNVSKLVYRIGLIGMTVY